MRISRSRGPTLPAGHWSWATGRKEGVVALRVSNRLGVSELARKEAAGWPPLAGRRVQVNGGHVLLLAHPGEPFHVLTCSLGPGLRVYGEGAQVSFGSSAQFDASEGLPVEPDLGRMPLWLLRGSLRVPLDRLAREMFDAALEAAEAEARTAGLLPFYL